MLRKRVSGIWPFTPSGSHDWPERKSPKPEECLKSRKQAGEKSYRAVKPTHPTKVLYQPAKQEPIKLAARMGSNSASTMSDSSKDRNYWIDEIAFLEARLNGSQGDIDKDDRAACEDALKAAKANLAASR